MRVFLSLIADVRGPGNEDDEEEEEEGEDPFTPRPSPPHGGKVFFVFFHLMKCVKNVVSQVKISKRLDKIHYWAVVNFNILITWTAC